jgi:mycothiol synthase
MDPRATDCVVNGMTGGEDISEGTSVVGAPAVKGLTSRKYRGKSDLAPMATLITSSREADGVDLVTTEGDLAAQFDNPLDFDPQTDVLVAEAGGRMIGLARVWREDRGDGKRIYGHSVELLKEWRGRGIREELFLYNEKHIREIAKREGEGDMSFFELWTNDSENEWKSIVLANGYRPVQHEIDMVRSLEDIPRMPLPAGLEIRPVVPAQYDMIWEANREACKLNWDYSEDEWDEAHFESFKKTNNFMPDLWQVAWDGDTLAGMVLNYIVEEENRRFKTKRGHTEHVFVREQYRGRGLARALLAKSFEILKDKGMEEATLGMEVENPHDPLRLYEGMGFRVVKHFTW